LRDEVDRNRTKKTRREWEEADSQRAVFSQREEDAGLKKLNV
jgi:hypothetical protein